MEDLEKQVRIARRRLLVQQYLSVVGWYLLATLVIAVIAVAVPKIWPVGVERSIWMWSWFGGAVAAGLLAAIAWTCFVRRGVLDAAIELDHRFGLKERISSSLALGPEELESEAGQALLDDALRRVRAIDVRERFPVSASRWSWLPLLPAAVVFLVAILVPDATVDPPPTASATPVAVKKQIRRSTDELKRKLAERRKKAEDEGLQEASDLFKKLEQGLDKMKGKDDADRKKAMVRLNDLAVDLKKRRDLLGGRDEIRKQLNQLKKIKKGPADQLSKAVKEGDFNGALDAVKRLQEQLQKGELDEQQQAALADQLRQMQEKLQQVADAHQQAQQQLQQQIQQQLDAGDLAQAGKLQQQLDRLMQQGPQMDRLRQMADKLGQAAQNMGQQNPQDAANQLGQVAADLEQMQQELDELEMLDEALDQIAQAEDAMNCGNCQGQGCAQCQGGFGGNQQGPPGVGMGEGQGVGPRPEEKTDSAFYDSRVRAKPGRGKAAVVDFVPGPNVAGQAVEEIKAAIGASKRESADPLIGQRLPRAEREQVKQYFDAFREGDN